MRNLAGPKHRQRFLCELRVTDFEYVAAGHSTNKKDSQVTIGDVLRLVGNRVFFCHNRLFLL